MEHEVKAEEGVLGSHGTMPLAGPDIFLNIKNFCVQLLRSLTYKTFEYYVLYSRIHYTGAKSKG